MKTDWTAYWLTNAGPLLITGLLTYFSSPAAAPALFYCAICFLLRPRLGVAPKAPLSPPGGPVLVPVDGGPVPRRGAVAQAIPLVEAE